MMKKKLIFIYNADSGKLNLAFDIAHKILSPSSYQCDLCSLSHGYFQMHASWKRFIENLDLDVEYLHRDEYPASAPVHAELPLILLQQESGSSIFMSKDEISACDSGESLQQAIEEKLSF
ncbi:MAG: hypothetical protein OEX12_07335 [Gammaproteobacteria bacterium]|nr:hypothetical protein [Gammaproteobacteria bacterium]